MMNKKKSVSNLENKQISPRPLIRQNQSQASKIKSGIVSASKPVDKENKVSNHNLNKTLRKKNETQVPISSSKNLGLKKVKQRVQRERINSNCSTARMTPIRKMAAGNNENNQSSSNNNFNSTARSSNKKMEKGSLYSNASRRKSEKKVVKTLKYEYDGVQTEGQKNNVSLYQIKTEEEPVRKERKSCQNKKTTISCFKILSKISQTPFSANFKVMHMDSGFIYCLKVITKEIIRTQGLQEQILSQIKFRTLHHQPSMQKLFTVFDDEINLYLLEEYLFGFGDFEMEFKKYRKMSERQCGILFKQLLEFYQFLHAEEYILRNLRMGGLVHIFDIVKIVDFSWVTQIKQRKQRDTFCGSYKQAPPELLEGNYYDESIDIWCLGTLLYEISTGIPLFENGNQSRSIECLNFPISMSVELVNLLGGMLSDKEGRTSLEEIMEHEWVKNCPGEGLVCKQIWGFWTKRI